MKCSAYRDLTTSYLLNNHTAAIPFQQLVIMHASRQGAGRMGLHAERVQSPGRHL